MRREGRVVYYGKSRQERYDNLRDDGFKKDESRELSRIDHPDDQKVLASMAAERRSFLRAFERKVYRQDWTQGQARYRYYKALREDDKKRGFASKANPLMARYHKHENKLRKDAGWKKGEYEPRQDDETTDEFRQRENERVRRRRKPKTPPGKGQGEGQVKAQRARANARKKLTRAKANEGKLRRDILEREVAIAPHGIAAARDPKIKSALRERYKLMSRRLDAIKDTGAKYG